jgi:hypothetical protein
MFAMAGSIRPGCERCVSKCLENGGIWVKEPIDLVSSAAMPGKKQPEEIRPASAKPAKPKKVEPAEAQLDGFLAKFMPEVEDTARQALRKMRQRLPGAIELVYDNYNALAIGFAPTERASDAIFSIALYPRWVSLFFLMNGTKLRDPECYLKGSGKVVRHIVLENAALLDDPVVQELMAQALELSPKQIDAGQPRRLIIKSVSAKQRPRGSK